MNGHYHRHAANLQSNYRLELRAPAGLVRYGWSRKCTALTPETQRRAGPCKPYLARKVSKEHPDAREPVVWGMLANVDL